MVARVRCAGGVGRRGFLLLPVLLPRFARRGNAVASQHEHPNPAGSGEIALMPKAGHSDMKATRIYLHLAVTVLRGEAEALERRLLGPQNEGPSWSLPT
jgi:hypothetical protein